MSRVADKPDKDAEIGTLIVVMLKARNLIDKHTFRKQDVFAQSTLNGKLLNVQGTPKRTEVEFKGGQHPVWDQEVRFPIMKSTATKYRKLEVSCFAKEPRSEDLLGTGYVDITETLKTGEFDDWVSLEIDGAIRGDMYLEMTYFANGPSPKPSPSIGNQPPANKLLSAVLSQNSSNLQRRPSKLSPNERLSRPVEALPTSPINNGPRRPFEQGYPSNLNPQNKPSQSVGLPSSLTPSSYEGRTPPKPIHSSLPPNEGFYRPSGGLGHVQPAPNAPLPSILRPGSTANPMQRPSGFGHIRNPSGSPPTQGWQGPTSPLSPSTPTNPYIGGGYNAPPSGLQPSSPPRNPYVQDYRNPTNGYPPPPSQEAPPLFWQPDHVTPPTLNAGSFSFPAPSTHTPDPYRQPNYTSTPAYYGTPAHSAPEREQPAYDYDRNRQAPQISRYQTPLPLPEGARPTPAPFVEQSQPAAPSPNTPAPDQSRIEALRRAEEDARRRREQEQRDMELAMQLDRELNLG